MKEESSVTILWKGGLNPHHEATSKGHITKKNQKKIRKGSLYLSCYTRVLIGGNGGGKGLREGGRKAEALISPKEEGRNIRVHTAQRAIQTIGFPVSTGGIKENVPLPKGQHFQLEKME